MPDRTLTLSDEAIKLLLVLLSVNRDSLELTFRHNFRPGTNTVGIGGRVPTESDIRMARELQLTIDLIAQFKAAK